jgi:riboflavin kinase/FMN adenylyltransferase
MVPLPAQINELAQADLPPRPLHLAIGMFDGVHLGHRAVIESAVISARGDDGLAGVLTFWPHPSALLRPESPTRLIQGAAMKSRMLIGLGVDVVITQTFTRELAALPAADFLPWLRRRLPRLAALYVGENFRFGQGRQGEVASLIGAGREQGIRVFSAARVKLDGEPISSTAIRTLLAAGEMAAANARLGYHYQAEGVVAAGKRLGRTLGFPTLNVAWAPDLRPRYGVYAVRVGRAGGAGSAPLLPAVANYGVRPTVENVSEPRLEVHVLGACPFGEGDDVRVEWCTFLRPEAKFSGIDELRLQIARDRQAAAAAFGV